MALFLKLDKFTLAAREEFLVKVCFLKLKLKLNQKYNFFLDSMHHCNFDIYVLLRIFFIYVSRSPCPFTSEMAGAVDDASLEKLAAEKANAQKVSLAFIYNMLVSGHAFSR